MMHMLTSEMMGGALAVGSGVSLFGKVLAMIGTWKMFTKAGVAGWKALIPYYNDFIRFDLFWDKKVFWLYLVLTVALQVLTASGNAGLIAGAVAVALLVVTFKMARRTAECFGMGTGMMLLLVFVPWLGNFILGFGKAEYTPIEK